MEKGHLQSENNTKYSGESELLLAESNLSGYNKDIVRKISGEISGSINVLEFGAGIGTLAAEYQRATGVKPECVELDATQRQIIIDRGFICYTSLYEVNDTYDAIYTSNVLEHIENDREAISQLKTKLRKNRILVIYVPAFMILFSGLDSAVGHYRRYHKKELMEKVINSGFKVRKCHFVDSVGFMAWLYIKFRGYDRKEKSGGGKSMMIYDKIVYPISKVFDLVGFRYLFGKNIMLVASNDYE